MKRLRSLLFWHSVIMLSLPCAAALGTAAPEPVRLEIVDRAIEHHGGEIYRSNSATLDVCSKSGCFHLETRAYRDGFHYTVSGRSRDAELEVASSGEGLTVSKDGKPLVLGPGDDQRYRDWAMARIYFCFLPYRLNDPGVHKKDLGLVDWDGRRLHRVKVTFEPESSTDATDQYIYWFDPESARLEYFAYSYDDNGGGLRFRRTVNHRRVGGVLFFDQENFGVEGPGLSVDAIDPAYVREKMRHISTVRLKEIHLRALR